METPKWLAIHKPGAGAELIPSANVASVYAESTVVEGKVTILSLRIRTIADSGYRLVDHDQIPAVAEALGIMEALGGQSHFAVAGAEATVARGEANQYRKLHALLKQTRVLVLIQDDAGNVRIKNGNLGVSQGESLSDALDRTEVQL